jgi:DNA (cytosine-5)-methyltransferase 1
VNSASTPQATGGRRPIAIDLFSGAGGLSLGLEWAGFDVRLGLDFDPHALRTFAFNHRGKALLADVREVSGADVLSEAGVHDVDLMAGGPSCQGFSTHGKRFADDERNFLYKEFLRLVGEIRPATVLIENVKGMLIAKRGAFRDEVYASFRELGYEITGKLVLAADYGVPQLRERVVFLATRLSDEAPPHPAPTFADAQTLDAAGGVRPSHRTVADAIGDLPRWGVETHETSIRYATDPQSEYQSELRAAAEVVYNHVTRPPSDHALSIISRVGQGQGLRSLPIEELPDRFKRMRTISTGELRRDCTTLYHRLASGRPSYTITCYFTNVSAGAFTHPSENRAISAREAARLQSFPDWFRFVGSYIPRQIGNAVPPLLAKEYGKVVLDHLAEHGDFSAAATMEPAGGRP